MDENKARLKAQNAAKQTVDHGTQSQRIDLAIAELDRNENNWYGVREQPLLTPQEYTQLLNSIAADYKSRARLATKKVHFARASHATRELANRMVNAYRRHAALEYYISQLAAAEEIETAVNVVLQFIPDRVKRKAIAVGLAKQIDHRGCCNSVSPDGMLIISKRDILADYDLETALTEWTGGLLYTMGTAKAYIAAIYEYMEAMKLTMPATKQYLANAEKSMRIMCLAEKYHDTPQLRLDEEPSKELLESGTPLLYDSYRLMPKYEDIEALQLAKDNINRVILLPDEK